MIQENRRRHAAVVTAVAKAAFNSAVDAVRAGGRVVAVGLPPEAMSLDIPRLVLDGIEVVGSLVGTRQDLVEAFQFAAEGKVVPKVTCVRWKISTLSSKRWSKVRSSAVWLSICVANHPRLSRAGGDPGTSSRFPTREVNAIPQMLSAIPWFLCFSRAR